MKRIILVTLYVIGLIQAYAFEKSRVWTDKTTERTISGTITKVSPDGKKITLMRDDQKEYKININRLSEEDQKYVVSYIERESLAEKRRSAIRSLSNSSPYFEGNVLQVLDKGYLVRGIMLDEIDEDTQYKEPNIYLLMEFKEKKVDGELVSQIQVYEKPDDIYRYVNTLGAVSTVRIIRPLCSHPVFLNKN